MSSLEIYNAIQISEQITTAGQPSVQQLRELPVEGFNAVINLATHASDNALADEGELVRSLGLHYTHIPVDWENPQVSNFSQFEAAMAALPAGRVLIHCAANYRVTAFYSLYAQKHLGWSSEQAASLRSAIWQDSQYPVWQAFIADIQAQFDQAER
jgi:protein tyrosine phosphatase (PTP) superfamily phosphohydrolase (DUF442 family)